MLFQISNNDFDTVYWTTECIDNEYWHGYVRRW